jgi:phospholipid/cholesterol/gamma-HCH transport system substrate-binding protein
MTHTAVHTRQVGRRLIAILAALAMIGLVTGLLVANLNRNDKAVLTAVFADSSPLTSGNEVRMDGVLIGKIKTIRLVDGRAHVIMEIDRAFLPLHDDASARIEPVSLLGERYVAIKKGTPAAPPLPDPGIIPVERTSASVDLDELLNTLDDPTSTALAAFVTTLGQGLSGNGDTTAKALQGLAPTFQDIDKLTAVLDNNNALLDHFVVQVQKDVTEFAPPLDSLVDGTTKTLGAVAANRQAFNDTFMEFPSTLASAQRTLNQLGDTAASTASDLRSIRPLTGNLVDVSHELKNFSSASEPALGSLPPVLNRLDKMLDDARPVADDLKSTAKALAVNSDAIGSIGHQLIKHPHGQGSQLENLMTGAAEWAMTTHDYDSVSHVFRAILSMEPTTLAHLGAGGLPATGDQAPFNPIPRDPRGQSGPSGTPGLPQIPALHPITPEEPPHSHDPPTFYARSHSDPNSASGMSPKQESDMFGSLLGGGK